MGLRLTPTQSQLLLPRLLQSVEILQLPSHELDTFLQRAAQENEALRFEPPAAASAPAGRGSAVDSGAWWEGQAEEEGGLVAHLEEQLGDLSLEPGVEAWVRLVIEALDARGHLSLGDAELLSLGERQGQEGGASALGRAIGIVQGLEPRGIGGRNAVESMLLQLDPTEEDYGLLCRILEEFLEELAQHRLPAVARALEVGLEDLGRMMQRLARLDPAPGSAFATTSSPAVRPEVVVEGTEAGYEVRVEGAGLPSVRLDPEVVAMASDRSLAPEARAELRRKVDRGRWIVEAMEQRRATLLRVARWVFHEQREYLERGESGLRPLTMGAVAEGLGLHLSTVSRSVAGKYADTPRGIVSLRRLFPQAVGGGALVQDQVAAAVREVVAAEAPASPLSDLEIVERLAERGVRVARRTVAKYRKELGIPSSYRRRRPGAA